MPPEAKTTHSSPGTPRADEDPTPLPSVETTPSLAPHSLRCRTKLWVPTGQPASFLWLRALPSSLPLPPAAASWGHLPNTPFAPVSSFLGLASGEAHMKADSWQLRVKPKKYSHRRSGQEARLQTSLAVQWLGLLVSTAGGDPSSIPCWGTKIPHAAQRCLQPISNK